MNNRTQNRTCKYCGKQFTTPTGRPYNAIKYCSDTCRKNAKKEQDLQARYRYIQRYQWLFKDADSHQKLGESKIGAKMAETWKEEYRLVHEELQRRIHKCKKNLQER